MKKQLLVRICVVCRKPLDQKRADAQTCSPKCRKSLSRFVQFHGFVPTPLEYAAMHTQRTKHAIKFLAHGKHEKVAKARTGRRK